MATLNAEYLFPDDIRNDIRMKGFAEVIGTLFQDLDDALNVLKIYNLGYNDDAARHEALLDAFAEHINLKGYEYLTDVVDKYYFCIAGSKMQRLAGTPWAIQEALELLGFISVQIVEGVVPDAAKFDGIYKANGFVQANADLAFSGNFFNVGADNMTGNEAKARQIIYYYKPASAYLLELFNH